MAANPLIRGIRKKTLRTSLRSGEAGSIHFAGASISVGPWSHRYRGRVIGRNSLGVARESGFLINLGRLWSAGRVACKRPVFDLEEVDI